MVTIGYGDINSKNIYESMVSIFLMIIGAGMYAFNLNDISRIVGDYHLEAKKYK
jgi:hypothetical protein